MPFQPFEVTIGAGAENRSEREPDVRFRPRLDYLIAAWSVLSFYRPSERFRIASASATKIGSAVVLMFSRSTVIATLVGNLFPAVVLIKLLIRSGRFSARCRYRL